MQASASAARALGDSRADHLIAIAGGHVKVWILQLVRSAERLHDARAVLSDAELARCERVIDPLRRDSLLLCRAALRQILARELGLRPQGIELDANPDGRPVLAERGGPSFSVSHTRGFAAIAVSPLARIGIDIEPALRHVASGVISRLLAPAEAASVTGTNGRPTEAFLAHWTAKEACAKALGGGLARNLRSLELRDGLTAPALTCQQLTSLEIRRLALPHGLLGALAASAR